MKKLYWLIATLFIVFGSFIGIYLIPFLVWLFNMNEGFVYGVIFAGLAIFCVIECFIQPRYSSKTITYWISQIILVNALCFIISGGITLFRSDGDIVKYGQYLLYRGSQLHSRFGVYILNVGNGIVRSAQKNDTGEQVIIVINSSGPYYNKSGSYWMYNNVRVHKENGIEIDCFNNVKSFNLVKILEENGYIGYELGE